MSPKLPNNQGAVEHVTAGGNIGNINVQQTQNITIYESQKTVLSYSDLLPSLETFQGRTAELRQLFDWLAGKTVSLIGVRGEGGIGKSTLMARVFAECREYERKFWGDVRTNISITSLAKRALKELGVPITEVEAIEDKDLPARLLRHLQTGRYLVAIDNVESLLSRSGEWQSGYGEFFETFRDMETPSVLLLASREYPERYYSWLRAQWLWLEEGLQPAEGAALLRELEIDGTEEDLKTASAEVKGHPLALSLIAGWIREAGGQSGKQDVKRLEEFDDCFQITGRHRGESGLSVNSVLGWSIARLSESQNYLLEQITIFRGLFTVEAAQALVPDQSNVAETLRDLERRSLVQEAVADDDTEKLLYRLQPRIQDYVQQRATNISAAHEQAIDYFWNRRTVTFEPNAPKEAASDYFETFYHEMQLQRFSDAAKTVSACVEFLSRRGAYQELVELYGELYDQWKPTPDQQQFFSAMCNDLGLAYQLLGQYQRAIDLYQQSLEIARTISDQGGEANSLNNLGLAYQSLGQYQRAIDLYQQSLEIARTISDQGGEATSLGNMGVAYQALGQYQRAIDLHQQHLEIKRAIGDQGGEANALSNLGTAYQALGQYQRAIDLHQQSLEIARAIGDQGGEANSLGNLGLAYNLLGQYQQAIDFHQQSLVIKRAIGDQGGEATSLGNLGNAYYSLGQYQRAIDLLQQSLEIARALGDQRGEANSLGNLGSAYRALGQYQRAIDLHQQSLDIARAIGDQGGEANSLGNLGSAYYSLDQYQRAIDLHQQHLDIARAIGDQRGEATSLFNKALSLAKLDDGWAARQSLEQARAIYAELKLDHEVESCDQAIYDLNQTAVAQPQRAPSLTDDDASTSSDDWWERSLPTQTRPSTMRSSTHRSGNKWLPYVLLAAAVVVVILVLRWF